MPHDLNIVLVEPEIPMNTGTIGRLCLATGATLHLVEPFGFEINDSKLKRAGLDYWQFVKVKIYPNLDTFFEEILPDNFWYKNSGGISSDGSFSLPLVQGRRTGLHMVSLRDFL